MWHFRLPSPEVLQLSNEDLQVTPEDKYFAQTRGVWPSAWAVMEYKFRTLTADAQALASHEAGRLPQGPAVMNFWKLHRWTIPLSNDEKILEPLSTAEEMPDTSDLGSMSEGEAQAIVNRRAALGGAADADDSPDQ